MLVESKMPKEAKAKLNRRVYGNKANETLNIENKNTDWTPRKIFAIAGNENNNRKWIILKNVKSPRNLPRRNSLRVIGRVKISKAIPELMSSDIELASKYPK